MVFAKRAPIAVHGRGPLLDHLETYGESPPRWCRPGRAPSSTGVSADERSALPVSLVDLGHTEHEGLPWRERHVGRRHRPPQTRARAKPRRTLLCPRRQLTGDAPAQPAECRGRARTIELRIELRIQRAILLDFEDVEASFMAAHTIQPARSHALWLGGNSRPIRRHAHTFYSHRLFTPPIHISYSHLLLFDTLWSQTQQKQRQPAQYPSSIPQHTARNGD
eukprot:CAMPEP_0119398902 /NCGR_PEP_ID=MMETSP1334-20130426/141083_1 /TAXON_ID=127549 /ORGANISM="Calcidiscus leptoporus, Strain RCC1130" /LENGTH=220 /DNA_ID=CAMNT_0007422783 /DNA_START=313 /DNA_END=975 /DNA_ORIENTATION=+